MRTLIYSGIILSGMIGSLAWAGGLDVTTLGAKGDGKTDDTAAFVEAFKKGKDVYVPPGEYLVGIMQLPDDVYFHGAGVASRIVLAQGQEPISLGNHNRVSNLLFTGQEKFESNGNQAMSMLNVERKDGVTIDHVRIEDFRYTAIRAVHATDLRVTDCHIEKANWGILIEYCHRVYVGGNRVIGAAQHAIQFWGNLNKFAGAEGDDLIFVNNYCKDGGGSGIWGTSAHRVIMANNIVDGSNDVGLDLEWCWDSAITGNTVRNVENGGISLFFSSERVSIVGNTVINDRKIEERPPATRPVDEYFVRTGIWLTYPNRESFKDEKGHRDVTIVGNTVYCAPDGDRRALWIGSESDNITVADNTFNGGGAWFGGEHNVHPLNLKKILMSNFRLVGGKAEPIR